MSALLCSLAAQQQLNPASFLATIAVHGAVAPPQGSIPAGLLWSLPSHLHPTGLMIDTVLLTGVGELPGPLVIGALKDVFAYRGG